MNRIINVVSYFQIMLKQLYFIFVQPNAQCTAKADKNKGAVLCKKIRWCYIHGLLCAAQAFPVTVFSAPITAHENTD